MKTVLISGLAFMLSLQVFAENIDPYDEDSQYSYGENIGWLNFEPATGSGVHVASDKLLGFAWAENIGWISMLCENTSICGTVSYGVTNDGSGNLAGYAWAENVGWIHLASASPVSYGVRACVVTLEDLQNFSGYWLDSGAVAGNLDLTGDVDFGDYSIFSSYWQDFCPDGWQLKEQFPDNYDDITRSAIVALDSSLSTAQIDGSDGSDFYPGTYFVYQTDEGHYSKFIVENLDIASGHDLTISWRTFNADDSVYSSGSGLTIHGSWLCDLDAGLETGVTGADWHWNLFDSTTRFLSPYNGGRFMLLHREDGP